MEVDSLSSSHPVSTPVESPVRPCDMLDKDEDFHLEFMEMDCFNSSHSVSTPVESPVCDIVGKVHRACSENSPVSESKSEKDDDILGKHLEVKEVNSPHPVSTTVQSPVVLDKDEDSLVKHLEVMEVDSLSSSKPVSTTEESRIHLRDMLDKDDDILGKHLEVKEVNSPHPVSIPVQSPVVLDKGFKNHLLKSYWVIIALCSMSLADAQDEDSLVKHLEVMEVDSLSFSNPLSTTEESCIHLRDMLDKDDDILGKHLEDKEVNSSHPVSIPVQSPVVLDKDEDSLGKNLEVMEVDSLGSSNPVSTTEKSRIHLRDMLDKHLPRYLHTVRRISPPRVSSLQDESVPRQAIGAVRESKRIRKTVDRINYQQSQPKWHTVNVEKGRGVKLEDIPQINDQISEMTTGQLRSLHILLFGKTGQWNWNKFKSNIRQFNGFTFEVDSQPYINKRDKMLRTFNLIDLNNMCTALRLKKPELKSKICDRILSFLTCPTNKRVRGMKKPQELKKPEKSTKWQLLNNTKNKAKNAVKNTPPTKQAKNGVKKVPPTKPFRRVQKSTGFFLRYANPNGSHTCDHSHDNFSKGLYQRDDGYSSDGEAPWKIKRKKKSVSNEELIETIKQVLKSVSLEEITMKQICQKVYANYPDHDLTPRKAYIKETVKMIGKTLISTQEYDPDNTQEYDPDNTEEYDPGDTEEYDPGNTEEYDPNNMQEYDPVDTQEYDSDNTQEFNEQLLETIQKVLKEANLEEITMKQICQKIYDAYPDLDLTPQKDYIKRTVKAIGKSLLLESAGNTQESVPVDTQESDPVDTQECVPVNTQEFNEQLKETVQKVLKEANLEEMTMKQICQKVYDTYPDLDLTPQKAYIKKIVKMIGKTLLESASNTQECEPEDKQESVPVNTEDGDGWICMEGSAWRTHLNTQKSDTGIWIDLDGDT